MKLSQIILWTLVALFAVETVFRVFYPSLTLTTLHVVIMVAFALIHGALRYGWRGIAAFVVICLVVSNFFENLSVATGFPFGHYHYTDALGTKLFVVPLLIGPAYLGVGYMAWVIATIVVGDVRRGGEGIATFVTPFIGAFIMVLWDLSLDPAASTVNQLWIWEQGGGFFGVPLSNYLGWFLTVYVFMQLFALYLRARGPLAEAAQPKSHFFQAIAMYAVVAANFVLDYFANPGGPVTDATGVVWQSGDIYETAAITSLLSMVFVVALATVKTVRGSSASRSASQ